MQNADVQFLHANLFDGLDDEGKPILNRPPIRSWREEDLLAYLRKAPALLSSPEFGVNAFTNERNVPLGFHTDGLWIWPSSVPFYLEHHNVELEPALYERIRDNDYQIPEVSDVLRQQATDAALEPPEPRIHLANWERGFLRGLTNIMRLAGVDRANYQIMKMTGEGYYLLLRPDRLWEFSMIGDMSRGPKHVMATDGDLRVIGWKHLQTVMKPENLPLTSLKFDHADEWPYQPIGDSPPLTLLTGKYFTELPPGTLVDRYGTPAGNFAYTVGAPFETRSMPRRFTRDTEYHLYQVRSPLIVLTGTAIRWYRQPGGAVGYIFESTMESLVAAGKIIEVTLDGLIQQRQQN